MPELTPQDRESYRKLRDFSKNLNSNIQKITGGNQLLSTLKNLTSELWKQLEPTEKPSNFNELQEQVELVGGYLAMYKIFVEQVNGVKSVSSPNSAADVVNAINSAHQEVLTEFNKLRGFIEAADDDFVDEIIPLCSDPLFLGFLEGDPKKMTQQLMSDQVPALTDNQPQTLVDAWGVAVMKFTEDARLEGLPEASDGNDKNYVKPGKSETIAHFFCIHDQLEGLYSQLSTAVSLSS
jgi:hypothetical protein